MLSVEDWAEIRRLHRAERMPIKVIARVVGCAKNTVAVMTWISTAIFSAIGSTLSPMLWTPRGQKPSRTGTSQAPNGNRPRLSIREHADD